MSGSASIDRTIEDLSKHRCINHFSPRTGKMIDWVFAKGGEFISLVGIKGH